jgi:hypothetical protein
MIGFAVVSLEVDLFHDAVERRRHADTGPVHRGPRRIVTDPILRLDRTQDGQELQVPPLPTALSTSGKTSRHCARVVPVVVEFRALAERSSP